MCGCNKKKSNQTNNKINCSEKIHEFNELYDKILFLLKRDNNSVLNNFKEDIELWVKEASIKCPEEDSYNITKKFIEGEYSKYNS